MVETAVQTEAQREQQIKQAEEILASLPQRSGVGKGLFRGEFVADWVFPYPQLSSDEQLRTKASLTELREFCDAHLDPAQIDRDADIPRSVIEGLSRLGVLGMTAPTSLGGRGFTQLAYCRMLEEIGGRCSSTSIFVNAHRHDMLRHFLYDLQSCFVSNIKNSDPSSSTYRITYSQPSQTRTALFERTRLDTLSLSSFESFIMICWFVGSRFG